MTAENTLNKEKGLESKSLDEIQEIAVDEVFSIFPSVTIKHIIHATGTIAETESQVGNSSVRSSWNGGCFFYDTVKEGERFGSLVFIDEWNEGRSIIVNQVRDNVFMRLILYPQAMQQVLSELLTSGNMPTKNLKDVLGDIKELLNEKNKNKKVLVNYSLKSNRDSTIEFIGKNFGRLEELK